MRRGHLIIDVDGLQNVPNDQKLLLGFNIQISQYICINSPIISDVQDEAIRAELMERRLDETPNTSPKLSATIAMCS